MARERSLSRRAQNKKDGNPVTSAGDRYAVEAEAAREAAIKAGETRVIDLGITEKRTRRGGLGFAKTAVPQGVELVRGTSTLVPAPLGEDTKANQTTAAPVQGSHRARRKTGYSGA